MPSFFCQASRIVVLFPQIWVKMVDAPAKERVTFGSNDPPTLVLFYAEKARRLELLAEPASVSVEFCRVVSAVERIGTKHA